MVQRAGAVATRAARRQRAQTAGTMLRAAGPCARRRHSGRARGRWLTADAFSFATASCAAALTDLARGPRLGSPARRETPIVARGQR